jgi:hypothetical protein
MKIHYKYILALATVAGITTSGCKKEFFNRPPEDQYTVGGYYTTASQVQSSTNALYAAPWFGWNTKVSWAITELASGNGRSGSDDVKAFGNFSVPNGNFELSAAWNSLYTVVAQANAVLYNLPTVPASVPRPVVNNALGEAHVLRALAYFHLVRIFGNVPIIENPLDFVGSPSTVPVNPVKDVYQFIINDLKFGEANCTPNVAGTGHVSSGSASALLAKVYLYMQDYENARKQAELVINSHEFGLFGVDVAGRTYADLFKTANNNNKESIIALQWLATGGYGFGNGVQASLAYSSEITQTGDGYGVLAPTFDLLDAYEPGDARRKPTVMLPGDYYPEINIAGGGYTVPANASSQGTHAQIKKYVVGSPADNNGKSAFQSTGMNTYMLRLADMYLIAAESILGTSVGASPTGLPLTASTADATALKYFNTIRQRAGLAPKTTITFQDILHERRMEFAIEGDYWFDLCRIDGFNSTSHPKAIAIISKQDRGDSNTDTPPKRNGNGYFTPTDANFLYPYPATEVANDPALLQAPVPYVFK